jgi:16S rRNA (cytosine1402-N4)-methyltransferase
LSKPAYPFTQVMKHLPVLYNEIIHAMQPHRGGLYVDGTVGAGGHAYGILQASRPDGLLLGLDVDPQALALARERLAEFNGRARLIHASYTTLLGQLTALNWGRVDGILLDLGLSSMQLDTQSRGFSFQSEAPLDMRFNPDQETSAAQLVNYLDESALADILYRYGEEHRSRQVAKAIVNARPIKTTTQLAQVVSKVTGGGKSGIHPATRTFQALRIAVNGELEALAEVLPQTLEALKPTGRLAVISFHSLEDRIVKQFMRRESRDCICPPSQPVCTCGHKATLRVITNKPIRPQEAEISSNPRSRSARLRIAERIEGII